MSGSYLLHSLSLSLAKLSNAQFMTWKIKFRENEQWTCNYWVHTTQCRSYYYYAKCHVCLLAFVAHISQRDMKVNMVWYKLRTLGSQWTLLPKLLKNSFPQPRYSYCPFLFVSSGLCTDCLFINIPKGLFPSPSANLTTFSVISGSCNNLKYLKHLMGT